MDSFALAYLPSTIQYNIAHEYIIVTPNSGSKIAILGWERERSRYRGSSEGAKAPSKGALRGRKESIESNAEKREACRGEHVLAARIVRGALQRSWIGCLVIGYSCPCSLVKIFTNALIWFNLLKPERSFTTKVEKTLKYFRPTKFLEITQSADQHLLLVC